jgi:hypothetical protein
MTKGLWQPMGRSWKLFKVHIKYCNDKWLIPVGRHTFQNRLGNWKTERLAVFTANQGWGGNRAGKDCVKNQWRAEVAAWTYTKYYQTYLTNYRKTHGRTYNC